MFKKQDCLDLRGQNVKFANLMQWYNKFRILIKDNANSLKLRKYVVIEIKQ